MVLDDVAGEHDVLVRQVHDDVAGRVRPSELHQVDPALAEVDRQPAGEGGCRPGQAGDALVALEQAREAAELAVPVLLPALGTIARAAADMMT